MQGFATGMGAVKSARHAVLAVLALCLLPACALLKGGEAPRETYEISAPSSFSRTGGGTRAQILVKAPTALKAIDSNRIVLRPTPRTITYLAGAQWSDTVPRMVQAKLVEAFENTGRTGATAKPGDGLVIDYQLVIDIRRFEIINSEALIEVSIKLLSDKSGLVRQTRIFTARSATGGASPDAAVAALDRAFNAMARDVVGWVFAAV